MTSQVSQQLSAVAGMVNNPLGPVANAAQKHLSSVIRAKKRIEQTPFRASVLKRPRDSRQPEDKPDYGKHIWIYNKRDTNQVVYSLTKELDVCDIQSELCLMGALLTNAE